MTQPQQPGLHPTAPPVPPRQGGRKAPLVKETRAATPPSTRLAEALARSRAWARPAGAGARVAAFGIDLVVVLAVSALAWVLTQSLLLGMLALLEAAVILAVIEARTGLTVGNLLLRLRTVRDDSPFSPGVGRAAPRALVQGAGTLVGFVGGIAVTATSAADPMRMGRSIADRAGRTLVVQVPSTAERQAWAQGAEAWAASAQAVGRAQDPAAQLASVRQLQPQAPQPNQAPQPTQPPRFVEPAVQAAQPVAPPVPPSVPAMPRGDVQPQAQVRPRARARAQQPEVQPVDPAVASASGMPVHAASPILRGSSPAPLPDAHTPHPVAPPEEALPAGVVPVDAPIAKPPQSVQRVEVSELLLLTFDTGQRAQLSIPVAVNLGRKPERAEQDDQLVVVEDSEGTVSKTHLRLDYRGDSVWLTDLGSTNGSEILDDTGEGSLLAKGARVRLEDGSRVRIGNRSFTVATVRGQG